MPNSSLWKRSQFLEDLSGIPVSLAPTQLRMHSAQHRPMIKILNSFRADQQVWLLWLATFRSSKFSVENAKTPLSPQSICCIWMWADNPAQSTVSLPVWLISAEERTSNRCFWRLFQTLRCCSFLKTRDLLYFSEVDIQTFIARFLGARVNFSIDYCIVYSAYLF